MARKMVDHVPQIPPPWGGVYGDIRSLGKFNYKMHYNKYTMSLMQSKTCSLTAQAVLDYYCEKTPD